MCSARVSLDKILFGSHMISGRENTVVKVRALVLAALVGLAMYAPAHATGTFFRPAKATVLPPAQTKQSGQASGTDASANETYPETLSGAPQVVDTATLAIDGHRALLTGLE